MVPPSKGSVPCGDLNIPDTLPPSCLKVTGVVLVPCGEVTVTSQSPVMSVCAKTGDATSSESASSVDFKRVIQWAPGKETCALIARVARAARAQGSFADVTELGGARDQGRGFELAFHRDLEHLAVFSHRPDDRHLI